MIRAFLLCCFAASSVAAADLPKDAIARIGGTNLRHAETPSVLAFSPDGTKLASGGSDGSVRIWDAKSAKELHVLRVKNGSVQALAYSPDGGTLAVHFGNERAHLYSTQTYKELDKFKLETPEYMEISKEGKLCAAAMLGKAIALLDTSTGLARMELDPGVALALHPHGSALAVANDKGTVRVMEIPSGKRMYTLEHGEKELVSSIVFRQDAERIVTATSGDKPMIRVWRNGEAKEPIASWEGVGPLAMFGDNAVVGRKNGRLVAWNLEDGKVLKEFGATVSTFAVSTSAKMAATVSMESSCIQLWNLETGKPLATDPDDIGRVLALQPTKEGLSFFTVTGLWQWKPGEKPRQTWSAETPLIAGAFASQHAFVQDAKGIHLLNLPANKSTKLQKLPDVKNTVRSISPTQDGKHLVLGTDKPELVIVNVAKGEVAHTWKFTSASVSVSFSADDKLLYVLGRDGKARVLKWNPTAEKPEEVWNTQLLRAFAGQIAASPNGDSIASTSTIHVALLETEKGTRTHLLERKWEDGPYTSVAFAPDGFRVATGSIGSAGSTVLWERITGEPIRRFTGEAGSIKLVAFSPDGRTMYAAERNESITAWDCTGRRGQPAPTANELRKAWEALGEFPADAAGTAGGGLADCGAKQLLTLKKNVEASLDELTRIRKLIDALGSADADERKTASAELKKLGAKAKLELTAAATSKIASQKGLAEKLLEAIDKDQDKPLPACGEWLRIHRACLVLEQIGGSEAMEILELIDKHNGPTARDARAALKRMKW